MMYDPPAIADFLENAKEWLDVPYHHQGKIRAGADCAGWIIGCAAEVGINLDYLDVPNRPRIADGEKLLARVQEYCEPYERSLGALLLFKVDKFPHHFGIHIGWERDYEFMLHSCNSQRKVVKTAINNNQDWGGSKLLGCYKLPGFDYSMIK
ncbi:MAG: NlpC/P60 family protein [Thermosynechococcaceae cyanobacterium]